LRFQPVQAFDHLPQVWLLLGAQRACSTSC
jgi:hypothetical protein